VTKAKTKRDAGPKGDPTAAQFAAYRAMYDYFNRELFGGKLSPVMLNFSRKAKALGFFAPKRWAAGSGKSTHEISLNPSYLALRPLKDTASTLAHEMAHAWQQEFGKPGRGGYHNAEWAAKMKEIGLHPTSTGDEHGAETGDSMTHMIIKGGPFCRAFEKMPATCKLPWSSYDPEKEKKPRKASKIKYTCPGCECNAWAKPESNLMCGDCEETMEPQEIEFEGGDEADQAWKRPGVLVREIEAKGAE